MTKFSIAEMFGGSDRHWIELMTSTMRPLLISALTTLEETEDDLSIIVPPPAKIFNFTKYSYKNIKVVILGQDPYYTKGDAHGLSFSSLNKKIPPSLLNIYKCLNKKGLISNIPKTANLSRWADQGVLLLNAALTTRIGKAGAHVKIWDAFTDGLIKVISEEQREHPLIFMLWGAFAQKKKSLISDKCIVYTWLHPSPMAQSSAKPEKKFINCDHFSKTNNLLAEHGLAQIDWDPTEMENRPQLVDGKGISITAYTDGSCTNNGKGILSEAGYAVYFPHDNTVKYGKVPPVIINGEMVWASSPRGEGVGIIVALETAIELQCDIVIVTDSMFWKDMIEKYMPKWEANGIDFSIKKNSDLTVKMFDLIKRVKLTLIHVASHNKDPTADPEHVNGNNIADKYANEGRCSNDFNICVKQL
jgi:uracil-DNA glycosylase